MSAFVIQIPQQLVSLTSGADLTQILILKHVNQKAQTLVAKGMYNTRLVYSEN